MGGRSDENRNQSVDDRIRIEPIQDKYLSGACRMQNEFLGSRCRKRCLCIFPFFFCPTTYSEFKLYFKDDNSKSASAVAIRESDESVVGFVHMTDNSIQREFFSRILHSLKDGECYIEMLYVLPELRGKGVGTKLMEHCEAVARRRGAKILSLGVVARNPARRLYERYGFHVVPRGVCQTFVSYLGISCLLGFPHCGCGGDIMHKSVQQESL